VFEGLKEKWFDTPEGLASRLGLSRAAILGALGAWTQAGRAMFDLAKGVYRARELARDPLPMDKLRFSNAREEAATRLLSGNLVQSTARSSGDGDGGVELSGTVKDRSHTLRASLVIDADARVTRGECECNFYQQNKLYKGPCEHMLALRMHDARRRPILVS
jgi:hypothetical protein